MILKENLVVKKMLINVFQNHGLSLKNQPQKLQQLKPQQPKLQQPKLQQPKHRQQLFKLAHHKIKVLETLFNQTALFDPTATMITVLFTTILDENLDSTGTIVRLLLPSTLL